MIKSISAVRLLAGAAVLGLCATAGPVRAGGGPTVGPQVRVDTIGGTLAANETTASASDVNPMEIVAGWNDYRSTGGVQSGFSLSLDGGQTWAGFILRPPAGFQTSVEGDPMTAFDARTGTLWAGAIAFGGNGGLYVAKKDPGAPNFEPAVMADTGGGIDKGWLAAGPQLNQPNTTRLYCTYNFGIIWSDDMGQTWTNPLGLGSGIGFLPRVGPDGEIYVCYWDFSTGVMLKRSLNNGASFTTHRIATRMDVWGTQDGSRFPGTFRVPSLNYLDVDENTGTLYCTYFDTTNVVNGQRNVDLYFTKSEDQGSTWTTPRIINGDNNPPGDQFWPWTEVDSEGRIHIVYLDTRHTVQNDGVVNGMFDAYYAYSDDGGDTFTEFRLTPDPWNSADDGILGGSQFLGDYLGLAVAQNKAYPVYPDTSAGNTQAFTNIVEFSTATVTTDSFNVVFGTLESGTVGDLRESDDSYVRVKKQFAASPLLPEVRVEVEGTAGEATGSELTFTLEAAATVMPPAAEQRIELFNFAANQWEQVDSRTATLADSVVEVVINANVADYIENGTQRVRARLSWFEPANTLLAGWEARIDQAVWDLVP